jgi:hypothetical protein
MSLIAKEKFKLIVKNGEFPIFRDRDKVFSRDRKFHRVNGVSVVWNNLVDFPGSGVPNYNTGGFLVESVAASGHEITVMAFAHVLKLMGMAIKFVHFGPKCMLDQVIVMRRNSKVDFLGFLKVNFLLLNVFCLLIFFVVVIDYFFPLNSLHFCHQSQHLLTTFSVGFIK